MLQAALAAGTGHRRSRLRAVPAPAPRGPAVRRGRRASAARSTRSSSSGSATRRSASSGTQGVVDDATADWLADYRFSGDIWGYPEGETYFGYSPLVVVEASFAEAVVLETLLLSIYNHDAAIASAASRMTWAAGDRPCIEMGSRRTHEEAAVACARAAYVAGFAATSNLARPSALRRADAPAPARTRSRCCTTTRPTPSAPRSRALGAGHDAARRHLRRRRGGAARRRAGRAGARCGPARLRRPGRARPPRYARQLDDLGATKTRIIVTSDLDECAIAGLASAPVDGYGVGTALVTGSGHPTCGFVYKLVAREDAGRRTMVGGGEEEQGQDLDRRPQVRAAPAHPRRHRARPR